MSLLKTLTKVAIGIAVAKGVQTISASRQTTTVTTTKRSGSATQGQGRKTTRSPDDLDQIMDEILGSRKKTTAKTGTAKSASKTGLDDLFGTTRSTSRNRKAAPKGGIEDLISGKSGGGLGDLLGGILGTSTAAREVIKANTAPPEDDPDTQAEAALLLRCMIHAIKADGALDAAEKTRLMEHVGEATRAEIDFINAELAAAPDLDALLNDIPRGMEEQAYTVSLLAIDLDQRAEAEYLHGLASGLGIAPSEVNAIHDRLGAPRIYD